MTVDRESDAMNVEDELNGYPFIGQKFSGNAIIFPNIRPNLRRPTLMNDGFELSAHSVLLGETPL
jgi:hypothetical protein